MSDKRHIEHNTWYFHFNYRFSESEYLHTMLRFATWSAIRDLILNHDRPHLTPNLVAVAFRIRPVGKKADILMVHVKFNDPILLPGNYSCYIIKHNLVSGRLWYANGLTSRNNAIFGGLRFWTGHRKNLHSVGGRLLIRWDQNEEEVDQQKASPNII